MPFSSELGEMMLRMTAEDGPELPTSPPTFPVFWNVAWVLANVILPLIFVISAIFASITFCLLDRDGAAVMHDIGADEAVTAVPVQVVQIPN